MFSRLFKRDSGQAIIVISICLLCIVGVFALVVDTGRAYIEHSRLQRAVDSAALAGVQKLPNKIETDAIQLATEAFDYNVNREELDTGGGRYNLQITAVSGRGSEMKDRLFVVADTVVNNQLAGLLGYSDWPIVAHAGARIGQLAEIEHWIPIGVEEGEIDFYKHYRLTNTSHAVSGNLIGEIRPYVVLEEGNIRQGVSQTIKKNIKVGQTKTIDTRSNVKEICDGVDDRIKNKIGVKGCFNIDEATPSTEGINIIGKGYDKAYGYGMDPRLVYIPFVKQKNASQVEIVGFGLFYIEYAHFDSKAFGTDRQMSEIVGFFVETILEGPLLKDEQEAINYGVMGIEYIDFL